MTAPTAARIFAGLTAVVSAFQLALAFGAPWGDLAMGGAVEGPLPPAMRIAALVQMALLIAIAAVMLSRAGVILPGWRSLSRPLAWATMLILAISAVLNLVTPSSLERLIWAPVAIAMFLTGLRIAVSR